VQYTSHSTFDKIRWPWDCPAYAWLLSQVVILCRLTLQHGGF
jgi:hypothetical protein